MDCSLQKDCTRLGVIKNPKEKTKMGTKGTVGTRVHDKAR